MHLLKPLGLGGVLLVARGGTEWLAEAENSRAKTGQERRVSRGVQIEIAVMRHGIHEMGFTKKKSHVIQDYGKESSIHKLGMASQKWCRG